MSSKPGGKMRGASFVLTGVGALLALGWLVTYLIPATREMMLDALFGSLLIFVVVGLLWQAGRRSSGARAFWWLLAAGWGVGLLGNIAWGVYEVATGRDLPYLSAVDLMYLARYVLVFLAFWRYPRRVLPWRWAGAVAVALTATALIWFALFRPASGAEITPARLLDFLLAASYPVLDAMVLYAALWAWACAPGAERTALALLVLAMVAYGVANWLNFRSVLSLAPPAVPLWAQPSLFWPLSDILAGVAAGYVFWHQTGMREG